MSIITIIIAILIFGLCVLVHEGGHYIAAKKSGITVLEFAIGMGPAIYKKVKNGTIYSIRILPFGGFCSMQAEDEEATRLGDFAAAPIKSRIITIVAGVTFNFILAFICAIILTCMAGIDKPIISGVMEGFPAEQAGLQSGDEIISINGQNITIYRDISLYILMHEGDELQVEIKRLDDTNSYTYHTYNIIPQYSEEYNSYYIGIISSGNTQLGMNIPAIIGYSAYEVGYNIRTVVDSLILLIERKAGLKDMSGPVAIIGTMGSAVSKSMTYGISSVVMTIANLLLLLNANLGILNLLPFPALDGGRLVFLIIEAIRKKPVNKKIESYVNTVGFLLLMMLMIVIMFKDITGIFIR